MLYAYIHTWPHYSTRHIHKYVDLAEESTSKRGSRNSEASRQLVKVMPSVDRDDVANSVVQKLWKYLNFSHNLQTAHITLPHDTLLIRVHNAGRRGEASSARITGDGEFLSTAVVDLM